MHRGAQLGLLLALSCVRSVSAPAQTQHEAKPSAPMVVIPWFSLAPAPGAAEARLGLSAEAPIDDVSKGAETIMVFGRRRAPTEAEILRRDAPGAESWQSDAAQPMVPGMGDSCTYKSGCFDKSQPGLFSTIPSLLGDN